MFNKKILILALCCVFLSSCGQPQTKTAQVSEANLKVTASGKANSGTVPSNNNPGTPAEKNEQSTKNASADTPIESPKSLYYINKAYNVVPNKEGINKKVVLLTFDDGPKEKKMIDGLIHTLDKHQAKAIFFVNGYRVKNHPELLKLIYDRGQIIGNHSWDHIDLKKETEANMRKQLEDVQKIVKDTVGEAPKFFRPPFGSGNDLTHQIAKENNLIYMTWSNGSLDWDSKNKNKPDAVIKNVLDQLHSGSNILMHELPWTVEALDTLLTKLEQKGYDFVDPRTISLDPAISK